MNHPSLSARGKQIAALVAIAIVLCLPKHVECGYPGAPPCSHRGAAGRACTPSELEPFGFYLIEWFAGTDVGFAYSSDDGCRQ